MYSHRSTVSWTTIRSALIGYHDGPHYHDRHNDKNTSMSTLRNSFKQRIHQAIQDANLQTALDNNAARRRKGSLSGYESLDQPIEQLRNRAMEIRLDVVHNLDRYLEQFVRKVEAQNIRVHFARNETEAQQYILNIAKEKAARTIAKSKSMVSEEIHLNPILEAEKIEPIETDLGEFIVQIRHEAPAHLITPAVHLRKEDVAKTFHETFGMPYTTDVKAMNDLAHQHLRPIFLTADIGLSGVNFGIVETGTLCLVTNEGNGRMVTTIPMTHIALMGIERIVPTLDDLGIMLKLLPRAATGQKLTSYVTLIQSPRRSGDLDGPQERHLILVDNGRREMARGSFSEALMCIRCGACLNACPVFQEIGGHAYDSPYSGPIGMIVSPALMGLNNYGHLSKASTLCGACVDACPVKIDFLSLIPRVRDEYIKNIPQPVLWQWGMRLYSTIITRPILYRLAQKLAAISFSFFPKQDGWIKNLPPPFNVWTQTRDFPGFSTSPFRERWKKLQAANVKPHLESRLEEKRFPIPNPDTGENSASVLNKPIVSRSRSDLIQQFSDELTALGGEFNLCTMRTLADQLVERMRELEIQTVIAWDDHEILPGFAFETHLHRHGITLIAPKLLLKNPARQEGINWLSQSKAGLTGALAAFADTGTLVLGSGSHRSQLASLLPPIHIAIIDPDRIYPSLDTWSTEAGRTPVMDNQCLALVSGPSRTADIEMTLTIGVHGPEKLIVYCVDRTTVPISRLQR